MTTEEFLRLSEHALVGIPQQESKSASTPASTPSHESKSPRRQPQQPPGKRLDFEDFDDNDKKGAKHNGAHHDDDDDAQQYPRSFLRPNAEIVAIDSQDAIRVADQVANQVDQLLNRFRY